MIGDKIKFINLTKREKGSVTFGDNVSAKILGKGTVTLGNKKNKAENVLLVENMKPNILSVSDSGGYWWPPTSSNWLKTGF
jgi:hypothetical protein